MRSPTLGALSITQIPKVSGVYYVYNKGLDDIYLLRLKRQFILARTYE